MKPYELGLTLIIAFLWVILYSLNHFLFKFSHVTPWISLIFIPSGFKMACAAIFKIRSIVGLFIGSMVTGYIFLKDFSWLDIATFSLISSTLPYFTFILIERFLPISSSLAHVSTQHIISYATLYAFLNAFFHLTYRYHALFLEDAHQIKEFVSMMIGDFLGIYLFMWLIVRLIKSKYVRFIK